MLRIDVENVEDIRSMPMQLNTKIKILKTLPNMEVPVV